MTQFLDKGHKVIMFYVKICVWVKSQGEASLGRFRDIKGLKSNLFMKLIKFACQVQKSQRSPKMGSEFGSQPRSPTSGEQKLHSIAKVFGTNPLAGGSSYNKLPLCESVLIRKSMTPKMSNSHTTYHMRLKLSNTRTWTRDQQPEPNRFCKFLDHSSQTNLGIPSLSNRYLKRQM